MPKLCRSVPDDVIILPRVEMHAANPERCNVILYGVFLLTYPETVPQVGDGGTPWSEQPATPKRLLHGLPRLARIICYGTSRN